MGSSLSAPGSAASAVRMSGSISTPSITEALRKERRAAEAAKEKMVPNLQLDDDGDYDEVCENQTIDPSLDFGAKMAQTI